MPRSEKSVVTRTRWNSGIGAVEVLTPNDADTREFRLRTAVEQFRAHLHVPVAQARSLKQELLLRCHSQLGPKSIRASLERRIVEHMHEQPLN